MKQIILTLVTAFFALGAFAQNPDFTYKLGGKISYTKLTDAGVLIVANGDGLAGIKPGASQPHFNFKDYGSVKSEDLDFIPMSPYLIVSQDGIITGKKAVVDFVAGKKLFATEDNGWKMVSGFNLMLPQNKLVVAGQRNAKEKFVQAVGIYDLTTGDEGKIFPLQDAGKVTMGVTTVTGKPLLTGSKVLIPTSKATLALDVNSGKQLWEAKVDDISRFVADQEGKEIYAVEETPGGDSKIYKIGHDGAVLWEKGVTVKGKISRFEILPQGLAIVSDVDNSAKSGLAKLAAAASESKIGFLNAKDGSDLWEKAPKTKGYVQHFYVMSDGILFGMQEGGINKISFDGTTLFKTPLKTGENIHTMALTPQGLIYITDTDADIINLSAGESIWKKPIKYKKAVAVASAYDSGNKRYLISTGEELLAINEGTGDISTLATYQFEEKEAPSALSVRDGGILLSSDQNMMMLGFDGSKKFHEYYKSPGKSIAGGILAGVMGAASMAISTAAAYQGGRYGTYTYSNQLNSYGEYMENTRKNFAVAASASFTEMNKRFNATSATQNHQFILTRLDDGIGLVRVNKDTGKKDKEIILKDKKPEYEVDEYGGFLYYQKDGATLYAFDLKK